MLAVVVHAADVQDRDGARLVLAVLANAFMRLRLIWADGGYARRCRIGLRTCEALDDCGWRS
jgi:hypothetical protein